jgi:hypothetical protein
LLIKIYISLLIFQYILDASGIFIPIFFFLFVLKLLDINSITVEHLDIIIKHLKEAREYVNGNIDLKEIKNSNIVYKINFKSNVNNIMNSINSLRVPKSKDLF